MKYSKLFGKTIKDTPTGATLVSHKLLYQAGFIRESTAGRYYLLPLGIRVHRKLEAIIKEEMDKAGAQQLITPVLHPLELWKETNRTTAAGFELMVIKDRNQGQFVLGGTAEEMLVDLIRKFQLSYKDLPLNLYQFSTKFRDEARARGGLLRLREFMMKDAYSFDATEADFKKEYKSMEQTYSRIFDRLDLKTLIVESDNGYIGGEYCHEFIVESDAGESKFLMTDDGKYSAHEDVAKFMRDNKNIDEEEKEMISVEAIRGTTMEDGVKLHGLPMWQQIKDLMMVDDQGRMILGVIRGDYDVNEVKLAHLAKAYTLRHATAEEIQKLGSEPGFISPVGIKQKAKANGVELLVIGDSSLRTIKNAYTGDNAKHKDLMNVNIDRDYSLDVEGDIALAKAGYSSLDGLALIEKKGIEVGNIFQLGYHYSSRMKDATFADEKGEKKPYYMGCYGIGIARTLATLVEIFNDDKGIIWPEAVAPFKVHLLGLDLEDKAIASSAQKTYELLQVEGIEVLFDDREEVRAGAKFADADLIGIPYRVVISKRSGEKLEVKRRDSSDTAFMTLPELINKLR
ncbi:proline--tRNA ligase [Candidatus Daviesbacteria bacterium RIFCSPHIGHO2_01_FULL_44_29]|uniref:Proline--tRNA ligase n=1 Tax=Candidatus Daviesbacteria bacterium RIFCSPHIGHO2_02_FULL_43_12 TaxID=1797776 RepID=A0A1F5KI89_9BACT|nr:MAG: proline--tRNA ligase [Candidatus Daviesbacteria bacterium RIFCSPHIGHO2_01_FULL_44_29]OGE40632.1 MAG: proline--tRNA ligase [Candidatus Daviesbacteria bacterium RIFCSPHIGHO2_02_FULL_43_12]OGE69871.1 MAG: proline--tRNA ligase [Candidatus Daviesbacteria bacterium RIFCSPLOWO2_01_FULL_43_15]